MRLKLTACCLDYGKDSKRSGKNLGKGLPAKKAENLEKTIKILLKDRALKGDTLQQKKKEISYP
ncbi:MAG: hypothetical protein NVS1B13_13040 [Flavisolibacter sp.]